MRKELWADILIVLGLGLVGAGGWLLAGWPLVLLLVGSAALAAGLGLALRGAV